MEFPIKTRHLSPRPARSPRAFTLIEVMIAITIIGIIAVYATISWRRTIDTARQSKLEAIRREVGNAKEYLYTLTGNDLSGMTEDNRWLAIGNYLTLVPASASTNRFDLLRAFSSYGTFYIGNRMEPTNIGP